MIALSERIKLAAELHASEYPNGEWREANKLLGDLWHEAFLIMLAHGRDPWKGGNEARSLFLESIGL